MSTGMRRLLRLHDALTRATYWMATFGVLYLTIVTAGEVFGRYALSTPTDWAPDTAAVSFALVTFLAVPYLTWKSGHASMNFIVDHAPAGVAMFLRRTSLLLGVLVCGACAWIGLAESLRQIGGGVMVVSVTPIPKWVIFVPLTYALASSALYFLRHLAETFAAPTPR